MHHQHHFEQYSNDTSVYVSAVFAERLSDSFLMTPLTVIIVWNLFEKWFKCLVCCYLTAALCIVINHPEDISIFIYNAMTLLTQQCHLLYTRFADGCIVTMLRTWRIVFMYSTHSRLGRVHIRYLQQMQFCEKERFHRTLSSSVKH